MSFFAACRLAMMRVGALLLWSCVCGCRPAPLSILAQLELLVALHQEQFGYCCIARCIGCEVIVLCSLRMSFACLLERSFGGQLQPMLGVPISLF